MNTTFRTIICLAVLSCGLPLHAQTSATTLSGLPNAGPANAPLARIDTITATLDPPSGAIHGKPGQTIGWGGRISWSSNAGDVILFTQTSLSGSTDALSAAGYQDLLASHPQNSAGALAPGGAWQSVFQANTRGFGQITIDPAAVPGSSYIGTLKVRFAVLDNSSPQKVLDDFDISLNVSVTVDAPVAVEQTITLPVVPDQNAAAAPFTINATASSNLPVRLLSMNPGICTVAGNTVTVHASGTCRILAVQDGNDAFLPAQPVSRTFEVLPVPATVSISGSLTQTYSGTDKTFTATTVPPGLPVKMLYNGTAIPPRNPGFYLIQAIIDDTAHEGSAAAILSITDTRPPALTSYDGWLAAHFTAAQIQAGTLTGLTANPAGDGFNNLFKYAMDFDPLLPLTGVDRASLLQISGSGAGSVVFEEPATPASGAILTIQANSDPSTGSWQEIARRTGGGPWTGTADVFTGSLNASGTRRSILVTEPAVPHYDRRFYRLKFLTVP